MILVQPYVNPDLKYVRNMMDNYTMCLVEHDTKAGLGHLGE